MRYVLLVLLTVCFLSPDVFAQGAAAGRAVSKRLVDNVRNSSYQKAFQQMSHSKKAVKAGASSAKKSSVKSVRSSAVELKALEEQVAALRAKNNSLQQQINRLKQVDRLGGATFRAVEKDDPHTASFSGTVFKTTYNGKEEIFGVVAAHTIAPNAMHLAQSLHKNFSVIMFVDGERKVFPVEVVQISAPSMLDMVLVKFRPQDEKFLNPLSVQTQVTKGEPLYSHGYASGEETEVPRKILAQSYLSFRTTIPIPRSIRPGYCGSPVLNARHELVGIHTGSVYDKAGASCDVGYAMSAKFLDVLVRAYHNGGQATFPLEVAGHTLANMNVDEYVASISIYDEKMRQLWLKNFDSKFSQSKVEYAIKGLAQARYVMVTTRRAYWKEDGLILSESRLHSDKTKKRYKYDLWEKKIVDVK